MSKKNKVKTVKNREWLNPENGNAFVSLYVEEFNASEHFVNELCANLTIADCNRQINLEFYFNDEKKKAERLYKIDKLEEQLKILRKSIEDFKFKPKKKKKKKDEQ